MTVSSRGLRAFRNRPASRRQRSVWSPWRISTARQSKRRFDERGRTVPSQPGQLWQATDDGGAEGNWLGRWASPRRPPPLGRFGLAKSPAGQWMRQNAISVVRTRKHKVRRVKNLIRGIKFTDARLTAITNSISRRTCRIVTSKLMRQTRSGPVTSAMSGRVRAGCILL